MAAACTKTQPNTMAFMIRVRGRVCPPTLPAPPPAPPKVLNLLATLNLHDSPLEGPHFDAAHVAPPPLCTEADDASSLKGPLFDADHVAPPPPCTDADDAWELKERIHDELHEMRA